MRIFFQTLIASIVVAVPLAFIYITISTAIAITNISAPPVTIASENILDIFRYPGFLVFYVRGAMWLFFGCFLASGLTLFMASMKNARIKQTCKISGITTREFVKRKMEYSVIMRNLSQTLITNIVVAEFLAFISMTIVPVSGNFLDILAYPEFWVSHVKDVLRYFFGCFSASVLTLFITFRG
jgi:hypothetical protein